MKHQNKSASPGELAYSIDDPPRPVSTSENSSMGDVYLSAVLEYPAWCVHRLRCPHLSDHPTRLAKQDSNPHHGRSVPIPVPIKPLVVRFAETTAEILLRLAETSQQTLRQILRLPTTYINFADKNAETLKLLRQLRLDPKLDSNFVAEVAAAACPARCAHQLWPSRWSPNSLTQSRHIKHKNDAILTLTDFQKPP